MNKAKLKSYAPQARKDFIAAVTARANLLGLSEKAGELEVATSQPQGDATVIAGQAWPIKVHSQRQQLIARIQKDGFAQTMEVVAYTWFNRFAALRYMELHDYLGHGYRALSSMEGTLPDILTHATDLAQIGTGDGGLPGLKPALVVDMKLAGNRDGELYRLLLVAQCNALSNVMPFLFERIDDETELLLPDNLLRTDSVIAKLVASIEEEDWEEVEIIGWLYQFYISEKKDEVIGKVVKSVDIPAATQLFTPNWIVQYLVQNSVGRLWLMANPTSNLKAQWPYYIAPAGQTLEVQVQLDALIQTRVDEDGGSLNPETITMLDPACGSGHILVEAYEVLKAIYLERGYQPRSIPRLILEKNLFGLDIDDRATQMAGFALLMKARADDRQLFNEPIRLNVLSLQESKGLDADELCRALHSVAGSVGGPVVTNVFTSGFDDGDLFPGTRLQGSLGDSSAADIIGAPTQSAISALIATFAHAKTFGSLIQIPRALYENVVLLTEVLQLAFKTGDLYAKAAAQDLWPLVAQARVLGMQFDAVIANPPYMGGKYLNPVLKKFCNEKFPNSRFDLFSVSTERYLHSTKPTGFAGLMTPFTWMFLKSYVDFRGLLFNSKTLQSLIQPEYHAFFDSAYVPICTFVIQNSHIPGYEAAFIKLTDFYGAELQPKKTLEAIVNPNCSWFYKARPDDFKLIPGNPVTYWVDDKTKNIFANSVSVGEVAAPRKGLDTGENEKFLRAWYEVDWGTVNLECDTAAEGVRSGKVWFPINRGGGYKKWYGNNDFLIHWKNDGEYVRSALDLNGNVRANLRSEKYYFQESVTWGAISSAKFSARLCRPGALFGAGGYSVFAQKNTLKILTGLFSSVLSNHFLGIISQTLNFEAGTIASIPYVAVDELACIELVDEAVEITKKNWDFYETSWEFSTSPFLLPEHKRVTVEATFRNLYDALADSTLRLQELEERNNILFLKAYNLQEEVSSKVPLDEITLTLGDRAKDCQRLISYAIGCMMGRYSIDAPGLIYANSGNVGFDVSRYNAFPADADGIVPLADELWFEDEAASRIREFLLAVWGADTLAQNMAWLAESLGNKAGETPDETIRRYLADKFYKDHLQTYKKRPIYWLFSSGKQGAFQALVYLHRYHEGTLSRMRAEYVVPLTGKIQSRIDMMEKDAAAASSTAVRNKLAKEVEKLKKKHVELLAYDEQLRHHADMRITIDLDDGVKVNYGKFGDLLAEVKAVTGGGSDD